MITNTNDQLQVLITITISVLRFNYVITKRGEKEKKNLIVYTRCLWNCLIWNQVKIRKYKSEINLIPFFQRFFYDFVGYINNTKKWCVSTRVKLGKTINYYRCCTRYRTPYKTSRLKNINTTLDISFWKNYARVSLWNRWFVAM